MFNLLSYAVVAIAGLGAVASRAKGTVCSSTAALSDAGSKGRASPKRRTSAPPSLPRSIG